MKGKKKISRNISFRDYEKHVKETDKTRKFDVPLYGLVGEVGEIFTAFKKNELENFPGFENELKEELGDALWYLSALALKNGISLQEIAEKNMKKSTALWDKGKLRVFDKQFPEDEQLLRKFEVEFVVRKGRKGQKDTVKMKMKDCFLGDSITDNSHENDHYRYHDVFHLAYAAVLGWSPVVRRMMKRKRKSDKKIDEVEDGARAAIIEEAISLFVFNQSAKKDYYKNVDDINIDSNMMKIILRMVAGLEVKVCTAKEWETAIKEGFKNFHKVKENEGGKLLVDLNARKITYKPVRAK